MQTGCGSTPWNMWSFETFTWTCCFLGDTWAPLERHHGLLSIRESVGCFRFDEQEVHMHSTKNVNETHSSEFLMETSLDLGIKRWREMGSLYSPSQRRESDTGRSDSLQKKDGNTVMNERKKVYLETNCLWCRVVYKWGPMRLFVDARPSVQVNTMNKQKQRLSHSYNSTPVWWCTVFQMMYFHLLIWEVSAVTYLLLLREKYYSKDSMI